VFEILGQAQDLASRAANNWDLAAIGGLVVAVSGALYKFMPELQERWKLRRDDTRAEVTRLRAELDEANARIQSRHDEEVERLRTELEDRQSRHDEEAGRLRGERDQALKLLFELRDEHSKGLAEDSSEILERIDAADLASSWTGGAPPSDGGDGE